MFYFTVASLSQIGRHLAQAVEMVTLSVLDAAETDLTALVLRYRRKRRMQDT